MISSTLGLQSQFPRKAGIANKYSRNFWDCDPRLRRTLQYRPIKFSQIFKHGNALGVVPETRFGQQQPVNDADGIPMMAMEKIK